MEELAKFRQELDMLDVQLLEILAHRTRLSRKIGMLKKKTNLPIEQKDREQQILAIKQMQAIEYNVNPDLAIKIFQLIIQDSKQIQEKIMNSSN
jgi:chorismate mutase